MRMKYFLRKLSLNEFSRFPDLQIIVPHSFSYVADIQWICYASLPDYSDRIAQESHLNSLSHQKTDLLLMHSGC